MYVRLVRTMFLDFKYFVILIWCYLVLYPITMYSFKSEIQRQPTMFKRAKFCACNQE